MRIEKAKLLSEFWRLVRFGIIGFTAFLINTGLYALFSRVIWPAGNRTFENFAATVLASAFGFLAHRTWTFRAKGHHIQHAMRFVVVAVTAVLLQNILFWIGHAVLHVYDFLVIFLVSVLNPFYTYFMHRFYTFRSTSPTKETAADQADQSML
ncbi:MAG TPA: GtrA family protein [Patescibacteria group bacterium]|nr:GtrA family protein [Patescibacteria group bacterium]